MYAAIRQYKSKPGMADRLAERIKEAIPPHQRGFRLYGLLRKSR
jgi:hypothetical protein